MRCNKKLATSILAAAFETLDLNVKCGASWLEVATYVHTMVDSAIKEGHSHDYIMFLAELEAYVVKGAAKIMSMEFEECAALRRRLYEEHELADL